MNEIVSIALENEMDLIVAHKRMISVAEYLKLNLATQTTLATAVVEVSREVIDKSNISTLTISIEYKEQKYFLSGTISFTTNLPITGDEPGMQYAKKLVPEFIFIKNETGGSITLQIGIPRYVKLNQLTIVKMQEHFKTAKPATPYEELKARNTALYKLTLQKEEELKLSRYLDEKKNEFISTASHELKTPLTTVLAFAQLLLGMSKEEYSPRVRTFVEKIFIQSQKLQDLIQQLLDVSKLENGRLEYNKEAFDFAEFLKDAIDNLRLIHPAYTIVLNDNVTSMEVFADKIRMEQVIINLVNNAAKYSSQGSTIQVHMDEHANEQLQVAVTDQGIGISNKNINSVFNKFFREEHVLNKYAGLGMGLYITRNIVEEHGGTIVVKSKEGEGSSFVFTMPVVRGHL